MPRKPNSFFVAAICGALPFLSPALKADEPWRPLFDGRSLSGWTTYLWRPEPGVKVEGVPRNAQGKYLAPVGVARDPTGVFSVVSMEGQPAIRISGEILGALTSDESFHDYRLRLQMRWGTAKWAPKLGQPRDSGVLYHSHGAFGAYDAWKDSLEYQVEEGNIGDLWTLDCRAAVRARAVGAGNWDHDLAAEFVEIGAPTTNRRCIKLADYEKPYGQWNVLEVICLGDRSWHIVNGHVVMTLERLRQHAGEGWVPLTEGQIQLQSEGAEVFFRSVEVQAIRSLPPEYSAGLSPR